MLRLSTFTAALGFAAGAYLVLTGSAWSLGQLLGFALVGACVSRLLGPLDAFFVITLALALQGTSVSSESAFRRVLLPLWSMFAVGGLLACQVLRRPSLGRSIEHGPFGPGGA